MGVDIEGTLLPALGFQGGAGHLELLGGLTVGDPLDLKLNIVLKPIGPLEPIPAHARVGIVKNSKSMIGVITVSPPSHGTKEFILAKDGEIAPQLQFDSGIRKGVIRLGADISSSQSGPFDDRGPALSYRPPAPVPRAK